MSTLRKMKCEICDKNSEMNVTMPLPIGILKAKTCMMCGLEINNRFDMVSKIIKDRAGRMNISLPADLKNMKTILEG